jgi:hypothetical protein
VPSGWHHQVHNEADTLSINHNWFAIHTLAPWLSAADGLQVHAIEKLRAACRPVCL